MKSKRNPSKRTNFVRPGKANPRLGELLARYYLSLQAKLCVNTDKTYLSMNYADIFHNAIVLALQDESTNNLTTDQELLDYFEKKFHTVEAEIRMDHKLLNQTMYADNIQTQKTKTQ